MVFIFIEKFNLWNFIWFGQSTSTTLLTVQTHGIAKKTFVPFVSCDFEIGIHFGDVELKWNGIKHAKVILIFERNYANMYQPYVMPYVYAKSASHSYYYYTQTHDMTMRCHAKIQNEHCDVICTKRALNYVQSIWRTKTPSNNGSSQTIAKTLVRLLIAAFGCFFFGCRTPHTKTHDGFEPLMTKKL